MATATIYTTSTCPFCTMMINYLKEENISYEEINIQENVEEATKLVEKTGELGVPQTKINGQWILGFDPEKVQLALTQ